MWRKLWTPSSHGEHVVQEQNRQSWVIAILALRIQLPRLRFAPNGFVRRTARTVRSRGGPPTTASGSCETPVRSRRAPGDGGTFRGPQAAAHVPLAAASRGFLTAALSHLAAAGGLLLFEQRLGTFGARWDALLWLVLIGFVVCSTLGFSLHLLPVVARRHPPGTAIGWGSLGAVEVSVVLGALALAGELPSTVTGPAFTLAAGLLLAGVTVVALLFAWAVSRPPVTAPRPDTRPGDVVSVPLFLLAWTGVCVAAGLFVLAGVSAGPGFGWWVAAVHVLVLGHVVLLITAVTLRLAPRAVDVDPPTPVVVALAVLASAGAVTVPTAMLALPVASSRYIVLAASPEAAFAVLFVGTFAYLGVRARMPRPQLGLQLGGFLFLAAGGGLGLWMVGRSVYAPMPAHALLGALGFAGLTILVEWFGLVAPFQRISHAWTRRILWALAGSWIAAVVALGVAWSSFVAPPAWVSALAGGIVLAVALSWGTGTVPVLFPAVNPLPGLTSARIREIRERWGRR